MKVVLIGNYPKDNQESMERFAQMLNTGYQDAGIESEIWRPKVLFGYFFESTTSGPGKWFGYIDKWIIFPFLLRWYTYVKLLKDPVARFHVCDHSNSPYLASLPKDKTSITCHDVIAIRGGMGFQDTYQPASVFGKFLQKWIFSNLIKAQKIASVSYFTFNQLTELAPGKVEVGADWRVIYNGFNADFKKIDAVKAKSLIQQVGIDPTVPFILHVGSNLPRKNRKLLLDMVAALGNRWKGIICFAGKNVDQHLWNHARILGLQNRIVSVVRPDHATLEALYNACEAFVFPSLAEGFGWPVIEAQACGCPVIASNIEPMMEVSGRAALHADPYNPEQFAFAFLSLADPLVHQEVVQNGYVNSKRFNPSQMVDLYLDFHGLERKAVDEICS